MHTNQVIKISKYPIYESDVLKNSPIRVMEIVGR